jgi:hypothetical protein
MPKSFLLSRVLLRFNSKSDGILEQLSAVTLTPDGSLWAGSDELTTIERFSPIDPYIFGKHQSFALGDFIELSSQEEEIDIEGLAYADHYLWLTGSHGTKRKKTQGKNSKKDIKRLGKIEKEDNRYLIARIPVSQEGLVKSCSHPAYPDKKLTASWIQKTKNSNLLTEALKKDKHLGLFVSSPFPSKENGFDIEGLAVQGDKVFLGLRGPVLRGWAIILEIEVEEKEPGVLTLKAISESGRLYKKHFVDLNGLGVRELCLRGDDLIILAGPTMELEGLMRVFCLKNALDRSGDTISGQESGEVEVLFDLPLMVGSDHAEGLALFPCLGQPDSLLVVYDSPDKARIPEPNAVYADVFKLKV